MSRDNRFTAKELLVGKKSGAFVTFVILILVCLILLGGLSFHYLSRNDYQFVQSFILHNIEKRGYSLQYQAIGIKPSLFPTITLSQVLFTNNHVTSSLLEAEELDITFELLPLIIGKRLVLDELNVEDAKIFIVRDEKGSNNWFGQNREASADGGTRLSFGKSELRNVEINYSGPTFVDKKVLIREASIDYGADGVLRIDDASGYYEKNEFDFKGYIDELDGFLNGKGASLSLDLNIGTVLKLSMEGEIDQSSLPTEQGLKVRVSGVNVARWLTPFFPDVSGTDYFSLRGDVFRQRDAFSLDIATAEFQRGQHWLKLAGQVDQLGIETAVLKLELMMKGDAFHQLAEWKYLDPDVQQYIPFTDSYDLAFSLSGPVAHPRLEIHHSQLQRHQHLLKLTGQVRRLGTETAMFKLDAQMQGDAFHQLDEWKYLDGHLQQYIPYTDSYELVFALSGNLKTPSVLINSAQFQRHEHVVFVSGSLPEPDHFDNVQLHASGDDLSAVQAAFFPSWATLPYAIPMTGEYFVSVLLSGRQNDLKASGLHAQLSTLNNQVTLESQPGSSSDMANLWLQLETSGNDLQELANWVGLKSLPEGVEHLLRFKLQGSVDKPVISELDAELSYVDTEISLSGELPDIHTFENMALDFDLAGSEQHLASLLGFAGFPDQAIMASGHYLGSLAVFHLKDFNYQGARGRSSGDLYLDLTDKPELKASLGDSELQLVESDPGSTRPPLGQAGDFDLSWMDSLNLDIEYASLRIIRAAAVIEVLGSKIAMQSGRLNWDPLRLQYRGVTVNVSLMIDAASDQLRLSAQTLQIDFGALLAELGLFERFVGLADIDMQLDSHGKNTRALVANLHGKARLIIRESRVKDFGSSNMSYVRSLTPWRKSVADLEINCLLSTARIDQGMMKLEHVFMENRNMYVTGGGKLNLNDFTMDMAFAPRAKDRNFLDANVSLFVTGPMADPKAKVGKLSAISDVGLKYGQWALLGPLSLALPKLKFSQVPTCEQVLQGLSPIGA